MALLGTRILWCSMIYYFTESDEFHQSIQKLVEFDLIRYSDFIQSLDILSEAQKDWLLSIVPFRRKKILEWIGRGDQ